MAKQRLFLRQPAKQWILTPNQPARKRVLHLATGFQRLSCKEVDIGTEVDLFDWEAHVWDCPACGSLLLAIVCNSSFRTSDTDPVSCPVCGDESVCIKSSHLPMVRCLIDGMDRMTDTENMGGLPWLQDLR